MSAFQRFRGLAGTAGMWAVAWLPLGIIMGIYQLQRLQHGWQFGMSSIRLVALVAAFWMIWGAITGLVFGAILIRAARGESIASLSVRRAGMWGALAGAIPPTLFIIFISVEAGVPEFEWTIILFFTACAVVSAVCASATLALARRAVSDRQAAA